MITRLVMKLLFRLQIGSSIDEANSPSPDRGEVGDSASAITSDMEDPPILQTADTHWVPPLPGMMWLGKIAAMVGRQFLFLIER